MEVATWDNRVVTIHFLDAADAHRHAERVLAANMALLGLIEQMKREGITDTFAVVTQ